MSDTIYHVIFIISIIIASYSQILLKKGSYKKKIYLNKYTIGGYILMVFSTFCTLIAYKRVDLSLGQTLQALNFVFVMFLSHLFLKEKMDIRQIIGTIIIIIGIIIFSI